jgi:hypothetical protein
MHCNYKYKGCKSWLEGCSSRKLAPFWPSAPFSKGNILLKLWCSLLVDTTCHVLMLQMLFLDS